MIVRIDYPEPSVRLDLWGGVSGTFTGLDLFNRIIDQRWQNGIGSTPTDIDRYQYGYDQNSNRQYKANVVGTPVVSGGLDEYYTYDPLNRLTEMQRGVLNGTKTGITGTPSVEQDWTLDPTGNWSGFLTKASGTTDLDQTRTSNTVNEITDITESTGPTWVVPAYDAAGNTTTMPQVSDPTQSFTAVYDAWNRMVSISNASGTVATYAYDGRNRRIVKTTATETRHFYFTDQWQAVEERVGTATSMDKQYVWGTRYIDELICRDDATPQRLYAHQDANLNLTTITNAVGNVQQRFVYHPYGTCIILTAAWVTTADAYLWTCRFTGREYDHETRFYLYRRRYYQQRLGSFISRDLLNYVAGMNQYQYTDSNPCTRTDPSGLTSQACLAAYNACVAADEWDKYGDDPVNFGSSGRCWKQYMTCINGVGSNPIPKSFYNMPDENKPCCCGTPAKVAVFNRADSVSRTEIDMKINLIITGCYEDLQIVWQTCFRPDGSTLVMPGCTGSKECPLLGIFGITIPLLGTIGERSTGPHVTQTLIAYLSCEKGRWVRHQALVGYTYVWKNGAWR